LLAFFYLLHLSQFYVLILPCRSLSPSITSPHLNVNHFFTFSLFTLHCSLSNFHFPFSTSSILLYSQRKSSCNSKYLSNIRLFINDKKYLKQFHANQFRDLFRIETNLNIQSFK
jgi:hypothetical protein